MATTWRVLTWNILGSKGPSLPDIAAHLRQCEPDVVALQEVRRRQATRLAKRLGWQAHWVRKHYPFSPLVWWRAEGLAVLTPWALTERARTTLSVGEPIWIYRHRVMASATVTAPWGTLRLHDVHLSTDVDACIAQAQRAVLAASTATTAAAATAGGPRVVCGDLNVDGEAAIEVLREFRSLGLTDPGSPLTNPSEAPQQRIDYVLVPDTATVLLVEVPEGGEVWRRLSDHLPVLVEFEPSPA